MTNEQLKQLAKLLKNTQYFDYLEELKDTVSDIRNPIQTEHELEVRRALVEMIDTYLIQQFKVLADEKEEPKDNWA